MTITDYGLVRVDPERAFDPALKSRGLAQSKDQIDKTISSI